MKDEIKDEIKDETKDETKDRETPETPETPEIPEIPETPETPETPEIPETPETPETPEIPELTPYSFLGWLLFLLGVSIPTALLAIGSCIYSYFSFQMFQRGLFLYVVFVIVLAIFWLRSSYMQRKTKQCPSMGTLVAISVSHVFLVLFLLVFSLQPESSSLYNYLILAYILAMLPLFYSMFGISAQLRKIKGKATMKKSLIYLVLVPLVWYLLVNTGFLMLFDGLFMVVILFSVVGTYFLVFLLLQVLFLAISDYPQVWSVARFVLIFILPALCFFVTQAINAFPGFWDYSSPVYYLLVVINGVLILVPEPKKLGWRGVLFSARLALYTIVTYFFVVIAPFYSLSLIGIAAYGIGLLVLTPLLLWAFQTQFLLASGKQLYADWGGGKTVITAIAGVLVVPLIMVGVFFAQRSNFLKAVNHIDLLNTPNYETIQVSSSQLNKTLSYFEAGSVSIFSSSAVNKTPPPFITSLHNRVVGGETYKRLKTQDMERYNRIDRVYLNQPRTKKIVYNDPNKSKGITNTSQAAQPAFSIYDYKVDTIKEQDYYRSFVHLEIKRNKAGSREFKTAIDLPQGVFVRDYYLDVLNERKEGILTEKTSANWIYDEVTRQNLDPGIVNYTPDGITLTIFPFSNDEIRKTGIEFVHKEGVELNIAGQKISLAPEATPISAPIEGEGILYLSKEAKSSLPSLTKAPYYLFVVDASYQADVEGEVERLNSFIKEHNIKETQGSVTAMNYNRKTWSLEENWAEEIVNLPREGGFGYGLATAQMFREVNTALYYPVLVVVQDETSNSTRPIGKEELLKLSPEIPGYYVLNASGAQFHDFDHWLIQLVEDTLIEPREMLQLKYKEQTYTLLNNQEAEVVFLMEEGPLISEANSNLWLEGLNYMGDNFRIGQSLAPEEEYAYMIQIIRKSFDSKLMSPYSSYIVLETEEQEKSMLARQKQVLSAEYWRENTNPQMSGSNWPQNPMPTSEPSLVVSLLTLLPLGILYRKKVKKK